MKVCCITDAYVASSPFLSIPKSFNISNQMSSFMVKAVCGNMVNLTAPAT